MVEKAIKQENCRRTAGETGVIKRKGWSADQPFRFHYYDGGLHLFHHCALSTTDSFDFFHTFLHRRFRKIGTLFYFLQDSRPFVFLLKSSNRTIDIFIFLDNDADHRIHPLPNLVKSCYSNVGISEIVSGLAFSIRRLLPHFSNDTIMD
jgi:hypothetical protein